MTMANVLSNGLALVQSNPDIAVRLDTSARDYGWLYKRGPDHQWVTYRKLCPAELESLSSPANLGRVRQGTRVRFA